MKEKIEEVLMKQLELLHERSSSGIDGHEIASASEAMVKIAVLLISVHGAV